MSARRLPALLVLTVLATGSFAQQQNTAYHVDVLTTGLEHPWSLAVLPDGRMLVTERPGRLRLVTADGALVAEPVPGLPPVLSGGQAGLKHVALAPDFADSAELYLSYSCGTARANSTCLARARFAADRLEDLRVVFSASPPKRGLAHYGGRIAFLTDGTLLLTLGDGFDYREQAQNPANHLGKIVRLNRDGSVPDNNPFIGRSGHAAEVFTLGHRNVQGVVVDASTGRVFAHEHGPRGGDELNELHAGANYGWPVVTEGIDYSGALVSPFTRLPGYEAPLLTFTPSIAPADLALYRGEAFAHWQGDLLIAALARQTGVHRIRIDGARAHAEEVLLGDLGERIRSVTIAADGSLLVLTDSRDGRLLRIRPGR
jgi:aldose sugar dehydrogenase